MKTNLVTLIALLTLPFAAQAAELADLASPAEIQQELPQTQTQEQTLNAQPAQQSRLVIVVNKAERGTAVDAQTLEAWVGGSLLFRTHVSTAKEKIVQAPPSKNYPEGRTYRAHTPEGTFHITHRDINHVSNTWQGANMPFAQFFIGGIAIHATVPEHFAKMGQRDSGGCVRLMPKDAKFMWNLVDKVGVQETEIIVYDGSTEPHPLGQLGMPAAHGLASTGVK